MKKKIALIFGITGQDGSYLAEFLLEKNYIVHGVKRRSSSFNTERIDHIYEKSNEKNFFLHYGDVTDALMTQRIINLIKPDEIYNLAAQSHVAVSFLIPEYTANVDAMKQAIPAALWEELLELGLIHREVSTPRPIQVE